MLGKSGLEIRVWRASSGAEAGTVATGDCYALGFSPDSTLLAYFDWSKLQICLVNMLDFTDMKPFPADDWSYDAFAFSPDGSYIATATNRGVIAIWDIESGRAVRNVRGHKSRITGMAFSRDGRQLLTSSLDGSIMFWPVEASNFIETQGAVDSVDFSAEGNRLLTLSMGESGRKAKLIDLASGETLATYSNVENAEIFPNGRRVVTVSSANQVTIHDDVGKAVHSIDFEESVIGAGVTPDGRGIVVGHGNTLSMYDSDTGRQVFARTFHASRVIWLDHSPDCKWMALILSDERRIQLCDAETGRMVDSIEMDADAVLPVRWVEYSPDGRRILTTYESRDSTRHGACIYEVATKRLLSRITGHTQDVNAAWFLPDGRRVMTSSSDGSVRLWNAENGLELLALREDDVQEFARGWALAIAPHGNLVAIGSRVGVFLKQAATPAQVVAWREERNRPNNVDWWRQFGGIQDWLVLAPIHLGEQEDLADNLDEQQVPDEANLDPTSGEVLQVDSEKLTWRPATTSDCVLDLQNVTSPKEDHCLAYAVSHIYSDVPREGVRLLVGSDDLAKVYLNGASIYEFRKGRPAIPADDEVQINLRKGKNVLVCKVIDDERDWGVSAQVVGEDYQLIPGVTTGTNP